MLEYLYPHLKEFVLHNYVSRWQDLQFRKCLKNLHPKTILSCVDFSKNYTMKIQNKIQNMHCHNFQVTILVFISYWPSLIFHDLTNPNFGLIKEVHYFVSYDTNHDTLFVQHVNGSNETWKHVGQIITLFGMMVV